MSRLIKFQQTCQEPRTREPVTASFLASVGEEEKKRKIPLSPFVFSFRVLLHLELPKYIRSSPVPGFRSTDSRLTQLLEPLLGRRHVFRYIVAYGVPLPCP